jgi:hypothetical protein
VYEIPNLASIPSVEKSFRHCRGVAQLLVGYVLLVDFNEVAGMQWIDVQPEVLAAECSHSHEPVDGHFARRRDVLLARIRQFRMAVLDVSRGGA